MYQLWFNYMPTSEGYEWRMWGFFETEQAAIDEVDRILRWRDNKMEGFTTVSQIKICTVKQVFSWRRPE
jgi:hypothetical protein